MVVDEMRLKLLGIRGCWVLKNEPQTICSTRVWSAANICSNIRWFML